MRGWSALALLTLAAAACREAPRPDAATDSLPAAAAAIPVPADTAAAVSAFVQGFYDWYVFTSPSTGEPDWRSIPKAITEREAAFDSSLADALEEDTRAQREDTTGNIVGIEFDPFLNAQDICGRYVAGPVRRGETGFLVYVVAACDGRSDSLPSLVAEVMARGGAWVFTNFLYPGEPASDLRTVLADLRRDREPSGTSPPKPSP
jgi:hypothetical protein